MATEHAAPPVNGGYGGAPQQYNAAELPAHTPGPSNGANGQSVAGASASSDFNESPSKDEVGWYFVEQYYTTLSKSPDKLQLFYAKKSQFVSGVEAEKVSVSVGQRAIGERIKELGIDDCKVRVTNVDSQESHDKSIAIQVIGEMSNKAAPHRKFVQTFVLAKQHNGYYVLNDIFRYIAEEEEEEIEPEPAAEPEVSHAPAAEVTSSDGPAEQQKEAEVVNHELEQTQTDSKAEPASVIATSNGEPVPEPELAAEAEAEETSVEPEAQDAKELETNAVSVEPEDPRDSEPSSATAAAVASEPTPAPAKDSSGPQKPSAPKTWASMLAGNAAAKAAAPAVPVVPAIASPTPAQPKKALNATPAQVGTTPVPADDSQPLPSPGGWQTAGQEHARKQSRQQGGPVPTGNEKGTVLGYIKNVTERVDASVLKATLSKYGKLEYFDVSRPKNCAFVEFADVAGYNAAVAANPHSIGGEDIMVEERRPRPTAYGGGFGGRGGMRGGRGNMEGRTPSQGGRGGYQKDGGRGGYTPRGRGGTMTPRGGRGMPQAA